MWIKKVNLKNQVHTSPSEQSKNKMKFKKYHEEKVTDVLRTVGLHCDSMVENIKVIQNSNLKDNVGMEYESLLITDA